MTPSVEEAAEFQPNAAATKVLLPYVTGFQPSDAGIVVAVQVLPLVDTAAAVVLFLIKPATAT